MEINALQPYRLTDRAVKGDLVTDRVVKGHLLTYRVAASDLGSRSSKSEVTAASQFWDPGQTC